MPHTVYDERGNILLQTESEIKALYYGLQRQAEGRLTTILLNGAAEIMFAPATSVGQRAETALEYQQRIQSKVKEEMDKPERGLPTGDRPFMDKYRRGLLPGTRPRTVE